MMNNNVLLESGCMIVKKKLGFVTLWPSVWVFSMQNWSGRFSVKNEEKKLVKQIANLSEYMYVVEL